MTEQLNCVLLMFLCFIYFPKKTYSTMDSIYLKFIKTLRFFKILVSVLEQIYLGCIHFA